LESAASLTISLLNISNCLLASAFRTLAGTLGRILAAQGVVRSGGRRSNRNRRRSLVCRTVFSRRCRRFRLARDLQCTRSSVIDEYAHSAESQRTTNDEGNSGPLRGSQQSRCFPPARQGN